MTEQSLTAPAPPEDPPAEAPGTAATPDAPDSPEVPGTPPAPRPPRRVLRAVLRWSAAVVVFATVGAGTAYGIAGMERTDVPGLATESDGRWEYPTLVRPPLPAGSPAPFTEGNAAEAHHADLRDLLLPAPRGAEEDKALRGKDGWLPVKSYLAEFASEDREEMARTYVDTGLRHIAARGWTTPDGTRTRVYLLQFDTANTVETEIATNTATLTPPEFQVRDADTVEYDDTFPEASAVKNVSLWAYTESAPYGAEHARQAYLAAGDVYAVILQSRKGGVAKVPFQQTVVLQSQLLG